ncbi:hypothetical protein CANCADRAFT_122141 [Tortispora caseinolytica NRRL Y-17796]|uniref:C2H2-type domain-containing protein n=1 Tax=Tortispora caseinolytica NRRL Y-17796 TaxID=767744 RepID=A0A1E4THR6_9ASCO|nr:hypothetical protein CANCADRAFT_122141 [Tortispora caseinolytica NRRL Y-17796]
MATAFTCTSCTESFESPELQRVHMRSEWHRYNLKRKVAGLLPVTLEAFESKVSSLQSTDKKAAVAGNTDSLYCKVCNKKFTSEPQYENHVRSNKHLKTMKSKPILSSEPAPQTASEPKTVQQEAEQETKMETEDDIIDQKIKQGTKILPNQCLFCSTSSEDILSNIDHMRKSHGLYIPDPDHLDNLEGLLIYLGEKIGIGNVCLVCSFQGRNLESIRAHMVDKHHCRIPFETEDDIAEIAEYYADYDDDEWEDDDNDNDDAEMTMTTIDSSAPILDESGLELYLPSGSTIYHRSLAKYFRQHIKSNQMSDGQSTIVAADTRRLLARPRDKIYEKARNISQEQRLKYMRHENRVHAKRSNYQAHFRDQLLQ